uniref:Uncharacterized protein n=1 Tax=Panagrolaimus sp. PS1159 TaxID=55785 RepID=A0AC35EZC6_9BILA
MSDFVTSESPTTADTVQIWTILLLCIIFCIAVRHLNDFFAGETITLVEEGTWGGRFKHREDYRFLTQVENDFAKMYYEITEADKRRNTIINRDILEEVDTDSD